MTPPSPTSWKIDRHPPPGAPDLSRPLEPNRPGRAARAGEGPAAHLQPRPAGRQARRVRGAQGPARHCRGARR
ncbi:MAG: hypothetical protein EBU62_04970, partial [Proteobacteria bacterium]|nr:hypothetical protein [Pseudomonadota bacterium]